MILKKLILFFFIVVIGISTGLFLINFISAQLSVPPGMTDLVMVLYIFLFVIVSLVLGKDIPKEYHESGEITLPSERKKGAGKSYAWLIPYGTQNQAGFPITRKLMTIGREVQVDILINDLSISKKHAQIMSLPGGFMLKDLESSNGTFINNQRIEESYLADGDVITFGEIKFVFSCSKAKQALAEGEVDMTPEVEMEMEEYATHVSTGTRLKTGSRLKDLSKETKSKLRNAPDDQTYTPPGSENDSPPLLP